MKTKPRLFLIIVSLLSFLGLPLFAELNPADLSGQYDCQGASYTGTVTIRKTQGGAYNLSWNFSSGNHKGVGVSDGQVLASTFTSGKMTGVVLYRIEGDKLVGTYTAPVAKGEVAEETLTYTGPPAGKKKAKKAKGFSKVQTLPQPEAAVAVQELTTGMRVAAKWQSAYYGATLGKREGESFTVKWDDDSTSSVAIGDILPIVPGQIKVDSRVMAVWSKNGRMYDGTVLAKNGESFTVKWDDGSAPSDVTADNIVPLDKDNCPAPKVEHEETIFESLQLSR